MQSGLDWRREGNDGITSATCATTLLQHERDIHEMGNYLLRLLEEGPGELRQRQLAQRTHAHVHDRLLRRQ